jgi:hypothetical protein
MARKTMTRADMIALLKSRGQKGPLSKMTKEKLQKLIHDTAPPDDKHHDSGRTDRPSGELELEPDEHQKGGHYFDKAGKAHAARHARHTHEKSTWPVSQDGSGSGHGYRDFMKTHLKQYGGSMQKAAAAYREQQKGGHFAKRDGSPGRGEDSDKYHHTHTPDKNPAQSGGHYATAKGAPAKGESAKYKHSHTPSANAAKGKAAAAAPAPAPPPAPKPAPARKPKDLSKIPDSMLTDAERKQKKAAADAEAAKEKAASRERRRKVAGEEERYRKEAEEADRQYRERVRKREADKKKAKADAAARKRAAVSKAKATLKSGKPMNAYQRFAAEQRSRGVTDLTLIGRSWREVKERQERRERDERDRRDDAEFARRERAETRGELPKIRKKQRGKGMYDEQDGGGFLDDIEGGYSDAKSWVGRAAQTVKGAYDSTEAYVDKHPMLHDLQDTAIAIGGVALASTGIGALAEGAAALGAAGDAVAGVTELAEGAEGAADTIEAPGAGEPDEIDELLANHNPASVGDAAAGADADAGTAGVQSDEVTQANEDAAGNKTFGQRLRAKLPGAKEVMTGMAVAGADAEVKDEEGPPPPPPPPPGSGTQQPPPLPPGYFEHLHDFESFSANSKALGESVPQPFLNPWYS